MLAGVTVMAMHNVCNGNGSAAAANDDDGDRSH